MKHILFPVDNSSHSAEIIPAMICFIICLWSVIMSILALLADFTIYETNPDGPAAFLFFVD